MKIIIKLIIVLIVLFIFVSCAGLQDWTFDLPNGYELVHVNPEKICLWSPNSKDGVGTIIPAQIVSFSYNEQYICCIRVEVDNYNAFLDNSKVPMEWYLVDTTSDTTFGPFSEDMFHQKIIEKVT